MKVAIDIRRARDYGVGTYTRNLVATLARLDTQSRYLLVGRQEDWNELLPLPANFSFLPFATDTDGLRHDARLSWLLERQRAPLLHTPYLAAPWLLPCRHIVTVHDTAEFLDFSGDVGPLSSALRVYRTRRALHRACCILSVSEATRRDLRRLFELPGDKIQVVYNALDARLAHQPPSAEEAERTLNRYSVQGPYLLYAGNVKPRKNIPRLIEAFALVREELREHAQLRGLKLIIIGDELSKHPQLRHAVVKSRTQQDVRFLGFLPQQALSVFYARAAAFVFPSLHEGFGLPPLEAMALGTPVVTSNVSALPEVLGEAAVYVNPENVFDISRGIRQALLDEKLRAQLKQRGLEQVRRFSWDDSVRRVLDIYRTQSPPAQ
ncbi:MAG: glycosyltransferase family 4 protein [Acidobacteria bacterium]|nr:glycosyltransferase family 4 protein [Acidobacteriota bacterium]